MVEIRLKNVNPSRGKNGKMYYYHRPTKQRLPGEPGSPEFLRAYAEAEKITPIEQGNISELIRDYTKSAKFEKRAESTKREYQRLMRVVEAKFGKIPIRALASPKVRAVFLDYQDEIALDRPREADSRLMMLSTVFQHAVNRGRLLRNPLEKFERAHDGGNRADIIWTRESIETFLATAPAELAQAMTLALHTAQRYGDLIRLRWSDYDGSFIRLIQSKGKVKLPIPVTASLRQMLDGMERRGPYILTRADGRPWHTAKNDKELGKQWRAHMVARGLHPADRSGMTKGEKAALLHFHDLRGTAITYMAEGGATILQICAVSGHTLQSANKILEAYTAQTGVMAQAAIHAFENNPATRFAKPLQNPAIPTKRGAENV